MSSKEHWEATKDFHAAHKALVERMSAAIMGEAAGRLGKDLPNAPAFADLLTEQCRLLLGMLERCEAALTNEVRD
jgi:hypothetical protein